jgi:hypothetical protein
MNIGVLRVKSCRPLVEKSLLVRQKSLPWRVRAVSRKLIYFGCVNCSYEADEECVVVFLNQILQGPWKHPARIVASSPRATIRARHCSKGFDASSSCILLSSVGGPMRPF